MSSGSVCIDLLCSTPQTGVHGYIFRVHRAHWFGKHCSRTHSIPVGSATWCGRTLGMSQREMEGPQQGSHTGQGGGDLARLTSERSDGVGGGGCSWAVVMLVNRWWLPYTFTWATQALAVMGRGWDIRAGQDPSKTGRASCSSSRTRGKSEKQGRDAECYRPDLEGTQPGGPSEYTQEAIPHFSKLEVVLRKMMDPQTPL